MHIIVKLAVCLVFLGEGILSWLYLTGRREQEIRPFQVNQLNLFANTALLIGTVIWL
jgi:uncharacterized protein YjeT (DUF2065 family)